MQIQSLGCISHFLPISPLFTRTTAHPPHCSSGDLSHEHVLGEWALRGHCAQAREQKEGVAPNPNCTSTFYRPLSLELGMSSPMQLAPSLYRCVCCSAAFSPSQPSCNVLWWNGDSWGPSSLFRSNPTICMLEKYWQPSDLSYLLQALPLRNAALFYWGEVCVLFNSECQAPRIAGKINVNQLQHNQDTHSCLIRVLSFPLSFSDLYTAIRNLGDFDY